MKPNTPTTQKQIRAVAYKSLDELQEQLDELSRARKIAPERLRQAATLLLEARALLRITVREADKELLAAE